MSVDIRTRPYAIAELRHYTATHFNNSISHRILGAEGITWKNATGQQSCAMRLSIALAYAGVHWPQIPRSWRLKGTSVYFPSYAGDYPTLLANREPIASPEEIAGRRGVIYFGGSFASASGHVTLWNGSQCHHNDAFWTQPVKFFWPMA